MINIICALDCEAKPIINHYGLQHNPVTDFKLYQNNIVNLVVSGIGKKKCASAIDQLTRLDQTSSAWLNIGIAGHGQLHVGDGRLIHKITNMNIKTSWYPPKLNNINIDSIPLITVDNPEQNYLDNCAYDMEAAYFYHAAIKHQTSELVQCYKIISDNKFSATENINANKVKALVKNKLPDISDIVDELLELVKRSTIPEYNGY